MAAAVGKDLCYTRGDTAPITITVVRKGVAVDLTGFTAIELVINTDENPATAANEVERFAGTLTGTPTDGIISFVPPNQVSSDALPILEEAFYDIQGLNALAEKTTLFKGKFEIAQDINKV